MSIVGSFKLYLKVLQKARADKRFRNYALLELWHASQRYFPARLVTPRRDYVFCRDLLRKDGGGRWLPPLSLTYRIGSYGLLYDETGRVLLVSNPSLNFKWNLPGGAVNMGETLIEGLQREFIEETGLHVEVGELLGNADSFHIMPTGRAVHAILNFYLVTVTSGTFLPEGNGFDTTKVEYIHMDAIPDSELDSNVLLRQMARKGWAIVQNQVN